MKTILVIGDTGVGKSSVVNLILGRDSALVANTAKVCTLDHQMHVNGDVRLIDTVGFNDADQTSSNSNEIITNLVSFLKTNQELGINLILFVMKKGRATNTAKKNYDFFVNTVCEGKVPTLLVVTHCESDPSGNNWYIDQKMYFEKIGLNFKDAVCGTTIDPSTADQDFEPVYNRKRQMTLLAIKDKIDTVSLSSPWKARNVKLWITNAVAGLVAVVPAVGAAVLLSPIALVGMAGLTAYEIFNAVRRKINPSIENKSIVFDSDSD